MTLGRDGWIVRELTPRGIGAISVIEVRGPGALERVREVAPRAKLVPGVPGLVRLSASGEDLDQALVCVFGPEQVEVHVHGSPALVRRILGELAARGATLVDSPAGSRGEAAADSPARSIEELALSKLPSAPCEAAARMLLDQAEGALRADLLRLATDDADRRAAALEGLLERGRIARLLLEPRSVVLAGPVNAGKSTLFNALLGERRAIVSDVAGTTRDWISEPALLGPWPVLLADTAGERAVAGSSGAAEIERRGQDLARSARERADLVIWLAPLHAGAVPAALPPEARSIRARVALVHSCADRAAPEARAALRGALSALVDPEGARAVVREVFCEAFELPAEAWHPGEGVPFEERQLAALSALRELAGRELARAVEELLG